MTTTVKTSHADCGDLELPPSAITLWLSRSDPATSQYSFDCPNCCDLVTKPIPAEVLHALLSEQGITRRFAYDVDPAPNAYAPLPTEGECLNLRLDLHTLDPFAELETSR